MFCQAKKPDGQPCRAHAMHGYNFCYPHNPDVSVERREAQRKGGLHRKQPQPPANIPDRVYDVRNPEDILDAYNYGINGVLSGKLSTKDAYALFCGLQGAVGAGSLRMHVLRVEALVKSAQQKTPFDTDESLPRFSYEEIPTPGNDHEESTERNNNETKQTD